MAAQIRTTCRSHTSPHRRPWPRATRLLRSRDFPQKTALFGDLHVHTSWSVDAYTGNNRLGPNTAYQFAKGEPIELPTGEASPAVRTTRFCCAHRSCRGLRYSSSLYDTRWRRVRGCPLVGTCAAAMSIKKPCSRAHSRFAGVRPMPRNLGACPDVGRCQANERSVWHAGSGRCQR